MRIQGEVGVDDETFPRVLGLLHETILEPEAMPEPAGSQRPVAVADELEVGEPRALEQLENWFGQFDEIQREKIRPRLRELPEFYVIWIKFREERQRALITALREAPSVGLSQQQLTVILLDPETDLARAFYLERDAYWKVYAQIVEEISDGLSKAQLKHAIDRLRKYAEAFEDLSNQDQS